MSTRGKTFFCERRFSPWTPFLRKPLYAVRPSEGGAGGLGSSDSRAPLRSGAPFARRNRKPHAAFLGEREGALSFPRKKGPLAEKEKIISSAYRTPF